MTCLYFYILKVSELQFVACYRGRTILPLFYTWHLSSHWHLSFGGNHMFQTLKNFMYSCHLQSSFSSYIFYRQQRNFSYFTLNGAQQQGNNAVECKQMWNESYGRKKSTYPYTVVSLGLIINVQKYNHMIRIDSSPKPGSPLLNRQENKKLGWLGKGERTRDSKWGFFS